MLANEGTCSSARPTWLNILQVIEDRRSRAEIVLRGVDRQALRDRVIRTNAEGTAARTAVGADDSGSSTRSSGSRSAAGLPSAPTLTSRPVPLGCPGRGSGESLLSCGARMRPGSRCAGSASARLRCARCIRRRTRRHRSISGRNSLLWRTPPCGRAGSGIGGHPLPVEARTGWKGMRTRVRARRSSRPRKRIVILDRPHCQAADDPRRVVHHDQHPRLDGRIGGAGGAGSLPFLARAGRRSRRGAGHGGVRAGAIPEWNSGITSPQSPGWRASRWRRRHGQRTGFHARIAP